MLDVGKNQVLANVPVGVEPEGMALSPDGAVLVNTSETTNMAHFIDAHTFKRIDNVLVDKRPRYAVFTPGRRKTLGEFRGRRHGGGDRRRRRTRS